MCKGVTYVGEVYREAIHKMVDKIQEEQLLKSIYKIVSHIYKKKVDD